MRPEGLHAFDVGAMGDVARVLAPSAKAAALFYAIRVLGYENLFVGVYRIDGEPLPAGDPRRFPWISLALAPVAVRQGVEGAAALREVEGEVTRCRFLVRGAA